MAGGVGGAHCHHLLDLHARRSLPRAARILRQVQPQGWQPVATKVLLLFTCEYCFSHYVTLFLLLITGYKLLYENWRGYLIAGFALVWMANLYELVWAASARHPKRAG